MKVVLLFTPLAACVVFNTPLKSKVSINLQVMFWLSTIAKCGTPLSLHSVYLKSTDNPVA